MKLSILIPLIAGICILGCSPGGLSISGTKCSGDLGSFLAQCVTNRGGLTNAPGLPSIQAQWTHQFRPNEDIVLVTGNHFSDVQSFLRQAYGDPDVNDGSSVVAPMGGGQAATYAPKQIGVALNFTGDAKQTVICILGRYGSVAIPPNPQGGANGWQLLSSDKNETSGAAATSRAP